MAYQSFDNQAADSNSSEKLKAIKLPEDLAGKSLLDIGCNEGFFCKVALERGATKVVGVDLNPQLIEKARERVPNAVFHATSWWSMPRARYDYILFLSAIHYEPEQKKLLELLKNYLKPGGTLILEGGMVPDWSSRNWKVVQRHDGFLKFPTFALFADELLDGYAVRDMGPSVAQTGDPQPRYVLHCSLRKPTLFLIGGESGNGKSNFARVFAKRGLRTIHLDVLIGQAAHESVGFKGPLFDFMRSNGGTSDIWQFTNALIAANKENDFSDFLMKFVSKDDDVTVIEGFPLTFSSIVKSLESRAKKGGFRVEVNGKAGSK